MNCSDSGLSAKIPALTVQSDVDRCELLHPKRDNDRTRVFPVLTHWRWR